MVDKNKFTNVVYFRVVWKILHVPMVGGFPMFTACMRDSCVTSAVLIFAVRALSCCRACISFMLVQEPEDDHYKLAETCSLK
jgi:hypothetical protein